MSQSSLLTTIKLPGFKSFLAVAFINAMVDLGHKILIQNTIFKIYDDAAQVGLTAIINSLILLPFILLFTPAGFLSDRFNKPKIMRVTAFSAIIITLLITLAYYQGWFVFAFAMTLILAAQSAIYSPAKYGYIRELAGNGRLSSANGFMQATTIIAILSGIFVFTILFEMTLAGETYNNEAQLIEHIAVVGWLLVFLSCMEFFLACRLPVTHPETRVEKFNWNQYLGGHFLRQNFRRIYQNPVIWYAILGLSMFWGISQTFLATFPAFAKIVLAEDNTIIIQGLLACSGIGIIIGSLIAGSGKQGQIRTIFIPVGAVGMSVVLFVLPQLSTTVSFACAITGFGLFGGLFIIPLNALIQFHAPTGQLGTILAGNNWIQNLVMLSFLFITFIAASAAIASKTMILSIPVITVILALLIAWRSYHVWRA
ncbi:MFS transporter [Methylophaga sp.]|uniref:MFS transporter n=1 Tax=Methylophaga sp. TaxID=2024840 RepID=UPI003F6A437E